jgi:hypothetical protein
MGKKKGKPNDEDVGAMFLAWFAKAVESFPDGLVTQAQASVMLGISRMAVSRLVTRGELRAVFFPEETDDPENPAFIGVAVGQDDPLWLKLVASISDWDKTYAYPKAVYVSFEDVMRLWKQGTAKEKCKPELREIIAALSGRRKSFGKRKEIRDEKRRKAAARRKLESE